MHAKFVELARDLGVSEPKTLEDVYKTHLAESGAARSMCSALFLGRLWFKRTALMSALDE